MTTLIGLFEDQQKAEKAIRALSAAQLKDVEFETIETWDEGYDTKVEAMPALNSGYGPGGIPVSAAPAPSWSLDDQEADYFRRNVQNGGVLIVVEVGHEAQVPQVNHILQENSVKMATSS
jgi:hypothetical protein